MRLRNPIEFRRVHSFFALGFGVEHYNETAFAFVSNTECKMLEVPMWHVKIFLGPVVMTVTLEGKAK